MGRARAVLLLAAFLLLLVAAWIVYRGPVTTLSAELHTEIVSMTVLDPAASALFFKEAEVKEVEAEGPATPLVDLLVTPRRGTRVTYLRTGRGELRVIVDGNATWSYRSEEQRLTKNRAGAHELVVRRKDSAAGDAPGMRLPVNGIASFGRAFGNLADDDGDAPVLLGGKLFTYGRALPDLFWRSLDFPPFLPNALFFVDEIALPGGSTLTTEPGAEGTESPWTGFADIAFGDTEPEAMSVSASANVARAHVYLPGVFVAATEARPSTPDVIALSLVARMAGDPNLQLIYAAFGLVCAAIGAWSGAAQLLEWRKEETHGHSRSRPRSWPMRNGGSSRMLRRSRRR